MGVGDVVLAKIGSVDETRHVNLSMREQGLRRMQAGQVMRIPYTKVPMVIGRGGAMIAMLKERTGCRIFAGQNGVIWMDGEPEAMGRACAAISGITGIAGRIMSRKEIEAALQAEGQRSV
jgi:exosome complex component RRP4